MNKICSIYVHRILLILKQKKEIVPFVTTQMYPEDKTDIMLSKIRQIRNDKYWMKSLIHEI